MEEGIYYKRGSKSDFAAVDMLPGGADIPRIVVEKITFHEDISINGRKEKEIFVATFAPNPFCNKGFVLNATNKARIAKMYWNTPVEDGTPCEGRINLLKNIPIRLTKEEARDVQMGGTTYGLRVSKIGPASEQEMAKWMVEHGFATTPARKKVIQESNIQVVVDWAKKNGKTIADIEAMYDMSQQVRRAIVDALKEDVNDDLPE